VNSFKLLINSLPVLALAILSGCAVMHSTYVPINKIETTRNNIESVEYLVILPKRASVKLGLLAIDGNGFAQHDDIIREAKIEAAKLGGDFILQEKAGTETRTISNPGYTTYQVNSQPQPTFLGNSGCVIGSPSYQASSCSVGPSVSIVNLPWAVFSVGVYTPSKAGLDIDEDSVIKGFNLNSDAESSGMRIGDRIIGTDGFDINDESLQRHRMTIQPGDKIVYSILRNGERMDFTITALPN